MNLDLESAKAAQKIITGTKDIKASEVENLITKTLGVLQENGVYACMLFLYSRTSSSDKTVGEFTRKKLLEMTNLFGYESPKEDTAEYVLKFLTDNICNDIDTLIVTKQLWEQTLIYARYGAKSRE